VFSILGANANADNRVGTRQRKPAAEPQAPPDGTKNFAEAREILSTIRGICAVAALDIKTHELGLEIAERCRFSIYHSLIVAAALSARCSILYWEDLQDGQKIDQLTIRNPFDR
jgi:predicted nucleic acid-binding protein